MKLVGPGQDHRHQCESPDLLPINSLLDGSLALQQLSFFFWGGAVPPPEESYLTIMKRNCVDSNNEAPSFRDSSAWIELQSQGDEFRWVSEGSQRHVGARFLHGKTLSCHWSGLQLELGIVGDITTTENMKISQKNLRLTLRGPGRGERCVYYYLVLDSALGCVLRTRVLKTQRFNNAFWPI